MSKRRKVYLPKWQRWFILPLFSAFLALFTYLEFFNPESKGDMGLFGYIFMVILFVGLGVMLWLMTSGRLPSYEVEEEEQ